MLSTPILVATNISNTYHCIIQNSYKRAIHSSANYSPFVVFYGLQHITPYESTITIPLVLSSHYDSKQDQDYTFITMDSMMNIGYLLHFLLVIMYGSLE